MTDPVDLLAATAELVAIPSVSYHEAAIADHVERRLRGVPWLEVDRVEDNVVARTHLERNRRLVLGGHLDTVPANENALPRVDSGWLWGLGSADMKAGLAVMLALAAAAPAPAVDLTFVFYTCEEVARKDNGLLRLLEVRPDLVAADAAILLEPSGGGVEAGCQGVAKLQVTVAGERAHSARPWQGVNAIHRLGPLLRLVDRYEGRRPVIEGCQYHEALQAVAVAGGVAGNVVPDRASVVLNHRFAPDRAPDEAVAAVIGLLAPALVLDGERPDSVEVVDLAPAARPNLGDPLLASLLAASGRPPGAKLGWTDVAFFAERGIPATNFGPGDPGVAHAAGERVHRDDLQHVYEVLSAVISG